MEVREVLWPDGKKFAFTIFDDTDLATVENVSGVYSHLADLGFRITKSVWPSSPTGKAITGGSTCADRDYLKWVLALQTQGFEIAFHMNSDCTSVRSQTLQGLTRFEYLFGHPPQSMANHSGCRENLYWGEDRLSGVNRLIYRLLTRGRNTGKYVGHVEDDPLFWGDLCAKRIQYCRNFVFPEINTLKVCPFMPYHDDTRPMVNAWFASSEGSERSAFISLLAEANQDRLEEEGGACIVYTHLAVGFWTPSGLDRRYSSLMERLASKNGWFVPVSTLMDYLEAKNGRHVITGRERRKLERRWLAHKFKVGTS